MREEDYKPPQASLWEYELPGGWLVMVGKTDADNDRLSLKIAGPNDYWFHVNGMPGSHAVLRAKPDEEPDRDTLRRAAGIAAWHSKARGRGMIGVSCTLAKYVKKPRGAKPGTVSISKEKTIKAKPALPEA
jgi:predicted ribosome quality control (RQC) complex YloA/Tae2 family protein